MRLVGQIEDFALPDCTVPPRALACRGSYGLGWAAVSLCVYWFWPCAWAAYAIVARRFQTYEPFPFQNFKLSLELLFLSEGTCFFLRIDTGDWRPFW